MISNCATQNFSIANKVQTLLPNDKNLNMLKVKAFGEDISRVAQMTKKKTL